MDRTIRKFTNVRMANFAMAEDRKSMDEALRLVKTKLGRSYRLHDGQVVSEQPLKALKSVNPADPQQVVGVVELASPDVAKNALREMAEGSRKWSASCPKERVKLLEKLGDWMEKRRFELAAWMVFEVAKTWREADADVCEAIDFCRYYAHEFLHMAEPMQTQEVQGELNLLTYRPRGVGLVIAPWNFPLAILTGMTAASLVTGNSTIIKPAEQSLVIAAILAQALTEVGFPKESFTFLPGVGEEIGPLLVEDSQVDLIVFTGSAQVGLSIIEAAARKPSERQKGVKKVIAEMGGKNAMIIDEDADLDEAVVGCIHSAFGFQGQKCSALSRLLVHENVYDQFVKRFVEATKSLRLGAPLNPETQVGPVIDEEAQNRILRTIEEGEKRAKTLYRAANLPDDGYYVPPTIFELQDRDDTLFQNEIFGPVVVIKKVHSLNEAIEDANSVRFALTGGVYSRSPSHIEEVKKRMEVGNLYINRSITGAIVQRQPFGGFKLSGVGSKAGGPDYLIQFVEPRTITENTVRRGFAGD